MAQIGIDLALSQSEVHAALKRLALSKLTAGTNEGRPLFPAVEEFLVHAVKYAFPAQHGEVTRGMLTAYAAPPLNGEIAAGSEFPPVWPTPDGANRGVSLEPLYKTVPVAASRDAHLYEILALVDAIRAGRARERRLAEQHLVSLLQRHAQSQPATA